VATGLRLWLELPAGASNARWGMALDFSDGSRTAPFEALPLVPMPADLPVRLGRLLPSFTLTTLVSTLFDQLLLPRVPQIAPVLEALGLASRAGPNERARVRNLARVVADPLGWLRSPEGLFRASASGTALELDPARVVALVRNLFGALGLNDAAGDVSLPLNLRLRMASLPQARFTLESTAPIALAGGVTLNGDFQLSWSSAGGLGAGGQLGLGAPLPAASPWGQLVVQAGVVDNRFTLALGPDGAPLQLLPFAGFSAASVGAAAERLLPTLIDAALRALSASADPAVVGFVVQLRAAAATLQIDSVAHLDRVAQQPVTWLRDRFSSAQAPASVNALLGLIPGASGLGFTAPLGELRFQPPGAPVQFSLGHSGSGIGGGMELNVDLGPVTLTGSLSVGLLPLGGESSNLSQVVAVALNAVVDPGVI
jgi:hypothetical protein